MPHIVSLLLALSIGVMSDAAKAENPASSVTAATLTKRVPPRYPATAVERGQEGWVDLRFTITPEGTTSDIRIVAAYPRGLFDSSANNAVAKWTYIPRREDGVAVPQANNHAVLGFALAESAAIREPLAPAFAATAAQVRARNWAAATKLMKDLTDTGALSLFELATIERLRGEIAFTQQQYGAAADNFTRALSITGRFDPEARHDMAEMLIMAAVNAHDFPRAVEAFDTWTLPDTPQNRDIKRTIEAIRAAMAAGRAIEITPTASRAESPAP
jgi:TonB family protein